MCACVCVYVRERACVRACIVRVFMWADTCVKKIITCVELLLELKNMSVQRKIKYKQARVLQTGTQQSLEQAGTQQSLEQTVTQQSLEQAGTQQSL